MRTRFRTCVVMAIFVLSTFPVMAQSQNDASALTEVREKIRRLEAMDVRRMVPSTLEIYQRTLLRLYEQCLPRLQRQIDLLAKGNSDQPARDALIRERAQIADNASILRMSLGLPDSGSVATSSTPPTSGTGDNPSPARAPAVVFAHTPTNEAAPTPTTSEATGPSAANSPKGISSPAAATDEAPVTPAPIKPVAGPASPSCEYTNVPPILKDEVQRLAKSILIFGGNVQRIGSEDYKLVFYTIADALDVKVVTPLKDKPLSVADLKPYQYLGETLRTDKQLGSSASSPASVSAVDKPGFAWLLGFGIENGLVEKSVRDSVLTLSSSPAALYMLDRNSSNPYQSAGVLNKIGVSASFNIGKTDQLLTNVTRSQLREYSVKFRFIGDRSSRSPEMQKAWDSVSTEIKARLRNINNASEVISEDPVLGPLVNKIDTDLEAQVSKFLTDNKLPNGDPTQTQIDSVAGVILCYLAQNVLIQKDKLSPGTAKQFKEVLIPGLINAQLNLETVRASFNAKIAEFNKGPLGTVAYINHREPTLGNYSEFKMLFEHATPILGPLALQKLTANAGFSFYHQPNPLLKQNRMRAVNGALSFEGSVASPFSETLDLSRITYSFVGSYERLFENSRVKGRKSDLSSFQFLVDVPLFKGVALPFSLTYSNATETDRQRGWHANFGLKMDTDKLMELVRAGSQH
jgi:hypothetical protein